MCERNVDNDEFSYRLRSASSVTGGICEGSSVRARLARVFCLSSESMSAVSINRTRRPDETSTMGICRWYILSIVLVIFIRVCRLCRLHGLNGRGGGEVGGEAVSMIRSVQAWVYNWSLYPWHLDLGNHRSSSPIRSFLSCLSFQEPVSEPPSKAYQRTDYMPRD
jgi:hypothetical protein